MSAGRLLAERKFQDRRLCDSPTDGFSRVLRDQAAWRAEWRQPSGTLSLHRFDCLIFAEGKASRIFFGESLIEKRRRFRPEKLATLCTHQSGTVEFVPYTCPRRRFQAITHYDSSRIAGSGTWL